MSPTGPGSTLDRVAADWLAELHQRLKASAERCYPSSAKRFRLQGEVDLFFALNEQGAVTHARLNRSSGSAILDEAATQCVLQGALPAPGRPGEYDVTIKFGDER